MLTVSMTLILVSGCQTGNIYNTQFDNATVKSIPQFEHLQNALSQDDANLKDLQVKELIEAEDVSFANAPNPGKLLESDYLKNKKTAMPKNPVRLKVISYNTGLLDRVKIMGMFGRVAVPFKKNRVNHIFSTVQNEEADFIFLQEIWEPEDLDIIKKNASQGGYIAYSGTRLQNKHGLLILVKKTILDSSISQREIFYNSQFGLEHWPGPNLKRAYLHWRIKIKNSNRVISLFNTHLTASLNNWQVRNEQNITLGKAVHKQKTDQVFIGGDFNSATYYKFNQYTSPTGIVSDNWWKNSISYFLFRYYSKSIDTYAAANRVKNDINFGDKLQNNVGDKVNIPYGIEGFCKNTVPFVFTATECNSLYFQNYRGEELPARMDFVFAVPAQNTQMKILSSKIKMTKKTIVVSKNRKVEASDHYAIVSEIAIEK